MHLNFLSTITMAGTDRHVKFSASLTMSEDDAFQILEFREPEQNVLNRIEVSDRQVNIFSGPATLNLILNEDLANEYQTPHGSIYVVSRLNQVVRSKDRISFQYTLSDKQALIGSYQITLEIVMM